jgi:hypothetical protein
MKNLLLTALVLTVAVTVAQAATTPVYDLSFTTSGSNWYLYVQQDATSAVNSGLSSFLFDIAGTNNTVFLTNKNKAPQGSTVNGDGDAVFTGFWYEKNAGAISVDGLGRSVVTGINAGQGTVYTGAHDDFLDTLIVRGFGQTSGTVLGGAAFTSPLLLESGTFSGPGTFVVVNASGNALNTPYVGPGNVTPIVFLPEPATMSLLVLGGLAALRRRRA